jgi:hypothetical protein
MTQQQLGQPVPRPHQVAAQVLARADEIAQRLFLDAGDRHPVQLAGREQPHQTLGVATVGLTRSLGPRGINPGAQTRQSTPIACSLRASTNPVGPASYVARTGPASPAANATTSSLRPPSR